MYYKTAMLVQCSSGIGHLAYNTNLVTS
jgi:hypothetical protein